MGAGPAGGLGWDFVGFCGILCLSQTQGIALCRWCSIPNLQKLEFLLGKTKQNKTKSWGEGNFAHT